MIELDEDNWSRLVAGTKLLPSETASIRQEILANQEKAEKYDKLIESLNTRRENNIKQRDIELKSGNNGFVYQLELGIDLISSILNYDFWKGQTYSELEQQIKKLEEELEIYKNNKGHVPELAFRNGRAYCKKCGSDLE